MQLRILVIDDEKVYRDELEEYFNQKSFITYKAGLPSQAFEILKDNEIDLIILDIRLPEMDGLDVLKRIKSLYPDIEVIMISGHGDMDSVIQSVRYGSIDFFQKPFRLTDVQNAIERTQKFVQLNSKLKHVQFNYSLLSKELQENIGKNIIYRSKAMAEVIELMSRVAKSDTTVLITGESGTGKELVARGIHLLSDRKNNYFYSVNCSAISESLFESEFFGHTKGAFTGATENKEGWFEAANHGILFLDEIGDFPTIMQAKLLRVLEEKKITRVGSHKEIDVNVRIIAATNQDLNALSENKKFRIDILHRLNSFTIHIPSLRERVEDIPLLTEYYIEFFSQKLGKNIKGVDNQIIEKLCNYSFPGNVRELKNMIERAVILSDSKMLTPANFIIGNVQSDKMIDSESTIMNYNLEIIKTNTILKALKKVNYNKSAAAKLMNITRQSLDRRLNKYKIKDKLNRISE
ncbi:MAG: sigma-54 dependent transcriptional regulator [Bacteroidia bacterium]|nr:sigma-54 dependent transcriptional regulator [Bacteroidia bacterium]